MKTLICCWSLLCAVSCGLAAEPAPPEHLLRDLQAPAGAVRQHAAARLGAASNKGAGPALVGALGDAEPAVRREAARALGTLREPRAVERLLKALSDPDANVRFYAAYALGEIKDPQAGPALLAALHDAEWCVRDQAAWAVRELQAPQLTARLAEALRDPGPAEPHLFWLLKHSETRLAIPPLVALLSAAEAPARRRAVRALGELRDATAVEPLLAALKDAAPEVRQAAVATLAVLGGQRVVQPLQDLLARETDPAVRAALEQVLLKLSPPLKLLAHWSFDDGETRLAKDVTGNGNDGTIRGCEPVAGRVGRALRFSPGKYVTLGRPAALPMADLPLTVMAWARSDAPQGVVVARGGAFCGFSLYFKDGVPKFGIHREKDGPTYIAAGREQVVGQWVHLAGVVKSDAIELYVNGQLAASAKTPGYIPGNSGQGMEIGFDEGNSPAELTDNFEGLIDEVKVYQAELSAEQISRQCR